MLTANSALSSKAETVDSVGALCKRRCVPVVSITPLLTSHPRKAAEIDFEGRLESLEKMVARVESKAQEYSVKVLSLLSSIEREDDQ